MDRWTTFKRLGTVFLISLALAMASCGGSDDESATDSTTPDGGVSDASDSSTAGDSELPVDPVPFPTPLLVITTPSGQVATTTSEPEVDFGGVVAGGVSSLSYVISSEAGTPSSGEIEQQPRWTFTASLQPGDNVVTVKGTAGDGTVLEDSITVSYNPDLSMQRPSATPEAVIKGESTPVLFSIALSNADGLDLQSVRVVEIDDQDQPAATPLVKLLDDGTNGDAAAGDGLYSGQATLDQSADRTFRLRVAADTDGSAGARTALSEVFTVEVISPFTEAEVDALEAASDLVASKFAEYAASLDNKAAATKALEDLKLAPQVSDAGVSVTDYTIWWEMDSGARAAFSFYPPGTKGSCTEPTKTPSYVKKSNAMLLEPYQEEFGAEAEIDKIHEILQGASCPIYDPMVKRPGKQATLDEFRKMDDYGVVVLSSHGGVWRGEVFFATEITITREHLTNPASVYLADFKANRLTWINATEGGKRVQHWALMPEFVYRYNTKFPENAIVHSATCSGAHNQTMANAFLAGGAEIYSGFTNTVSNVYGLDIIVAYFHALVAGQTVAQAHATARRQAGDKDPHHANTQFVYTPQPGNVALIAPCFGYTQISDRRDYTFGGSANKREESHTAYFSSDRVIKSPFDPTGNTFLLQTVQKSCSFSFSEISTLSDSPMRKIEGTGGLAEIHEAMPKDLTKFDPDARYGVVKFVIDRAANAVKFFPTPEAACQQDDDWVTHHTTSYSYSPPDSYSEPGGCSFWGAFASIPGFNNASDYILVESPDVEITDEHIRGSVSFTNDDGTGTLSFRYDLKPKK